VTGNFVCARGFNNLSRSHSTRPLCMREQASHSQVEHARGEGKTVAKRTIYCDHGIQMETVPPKATYLPWDFSYTRSHDAMYCATSWLSSCANDASIPRPRIFFWRLIRACTAQHLENPLRLLSQRQDIRCKALNAFKCLATTTLDHVL